jgi:hypothetical protein
MSHQDSEPEEAITKEEIHGEEPPKKSTRNACKSHIQLTHETFLQSDSRRTYGSKEKNATRDEYSSAIA